MTDTTTDTTTAVLSDEEELPTPPVYPDGPVGMIMQQRDQARAAAESDRTLAADVLRRADESDAHADRLDEAIASLVGGSQLEAGAE